MKKNLLSMFALATMLLATGCSQDEELVNDSSNYVEASFTLDLSEGAQSRTLGEGTLVNQLYYGVFQGETPVPVNADQALEANFVADYVGEEVVTDGTATVKVRLVKGQTYNFVFWAQVKDNTHYTIDQNNLKLITVNYGSNANDETRDAFFACEPEYKVESHFTKTVYLKRPFAQINVGTTKADFEAAKILLGGSPVTQSKMVVKNVPTTLNLLDGTVDNPTEATFVMADFPKDAQAAANEYDILEVQDKEYAHLAMNYVLSDVKGNQEVVEAVIEMGDGTKSINTFTVSQLPIHRNYRTNIIGNILTTNGEFEVIVDAEFEGDEIRELWDGSSKKPQYDEATKTWLVGEPAELAWIADAVNGTLSSDARSLSEPKNFTGETVKLTADINLDNVEWTPIGHGGNLYTINFRGTFDGENHTISNLKVTNQESAGLFGHMVQGTIKNVTIKNVTLNTNHYAGAIVAWIEKGANDMIIDKCHVDGGTITVTPELIDGLYDNGDKAGGIVGFLYGGTVTDSSVKNLTVTAYRDLGGIAGHAEKATVKGNSTETVKIIADQSPEPYNGTKPANANAIVGRVEGDKNTITDNSEGAIVSEQKVIKTAEELTAALNSAKGNDMLLLADGEYKGFFNVKKSLTIKALNAGKATVNGMIFANNESTATLNDLVLTNDDNTLIDKDGRGTKGSILCEYQGDFIVDNCTFNAVYDYPVYIKSSDLNNYHQFTNCTFNCNGFRSIHSKTNLKVDNCTFNDQYRYSVQLRGQGSVSERSEVIFTNNKIVDACKTSEKPFAVGLEITANQAFKNVDIHVAGNTEGLNYTYVAKVDADWESCNIEGATFVNEDKVFSYGLLKYKDSNEVQNYEVYNADGLATLNTIFADNTVGKGVVVNLTDDINFEGKIWTPVDSHADSKDAVLKELNGNGHTISNLTINGQAMFKRFAGNQDLVTIKDVTFDNATVNSTALNTSILTIQCYENILLDNVDVKNSSITGNYKVAPLIASVYDEKPDKAITATLKNCDVENTVVKGYLDFMICGMVAFVYASDNDKIEFENCTVDKVTLQVPANGGYGAYGYVYSTNGTSEETYDEATGVTVTNCKVEKY